MRQIVTMGSQDTLEEKTVTVCFGADFVNVSFINFCATKKEIAQVRIQSPKYFMYKQINMQNANITQFIMIIWDFRF